MRLSLTISVLFFVLFFLSACSRNNPEDIAERYWDATLSYDLTALEEVVTQESIEIISTVRELESGSNFVLHEPKAIDENNVLIPTSVTLVQDGDTTINQIDTVLVKENEIWKVDLRQTRRGLYASVLTQAITDISDSLNIGADAIKELGGQIAKETSENLKQVTKDLKEQAQEANQAIGESVQEAIDEFKRH